MADVSILREFLVSLGFDVDKAKFERFTKSVETVTKRVVEVGAAIEVAAAAVVAGVTRISAQFDDLYYASQRLHASVENIGAFAFSISQMGGTAAGARSALEGLAGFMRNNPGSENFLKGMGINTRDAKGALLDETNVMEQLAAKFKTMPYYRANLYAQMLGIDEPTLQAMLRGVDKYTEQFKAFAKRLGLNMTDGADASQKLMKGIRTLRMEFGLFVDKIALDLLQRWGPKLEDWFVYISNWLVSNEPEIESFADSIVSWTKTLGDWAKKVVDWFDNLDPTFRKFVIWLALIGGAIKLSGIGDLVLSLLALDPVIGAIIIGIAALAGAFFTLKNDYDNWVKSGKSGLGINWPEWSGQIGKLKGDIGDLLGAFGAIAKALDKDGLGQVITTLVHGALALLHTSLRGIVDDLTLVADALSGNWKKFGADALRTGGDFVGGLGDTFNAATGRGKYNTTQQPHDSPGGGVFGWLRRHRVGTAADGSAIEGLDAGDPENKPRTQVKATRDLTEQMRQLRDTVAQTANNASASNGSFQSMLHPASYVTGLSSLGDPAQPSSGPVPNAARTVMQFFANQGWGKFGAAGIAANLSDESGFDPHVKENAFNHGHQGLAQWDQRRQDEFKRWSGGVDIRDASFMKQLQFIQYELTAGSDLGARRAGQMMMAAHSAAEAARIFSRYFERAYPGYAQAAGEAGRARLAEGYAGRLGGDDYARRGDTHLHQNTKVTVEAANDPHATARAVGAEQGRINGDLVRNLKPALV